jgi:hypothetical protein
MKFGQPNEFCIEFEPVKSDLFLIFLWFNGIKYGKGLKPDRLIHCAKSLKKFLLVQNELIRPDLLRMSNKELMEWMIAMDLVSNYSSENATLFIQRRRFVRFLGDQMDEYSIWTIVNNSQVFWYLYDNATNSFHIHAVDVKINNSVFQEIVQWFEQNYQLELYIDLNKVP